MSKNIKSVKGFFGQLIHYEDGRYAGESWPGLFEGSYDHYNGSGRYTGYSDPGIAADLVHHDEYGSQIGKTYPGLFGERRHYSTGHGYVGESWEGLVGETTSLLDDPDSGDLPDSHGFLGGDDW